MTRAVAAFFVALALALMASACAVVGAPLASAAAQRGPSSTGPTTTAPIPPPKAWALVDADTGAVVDASREREPLRVASVFKLLTAIVVVENLEPGVDVPVSSRAEGMPARKINLKAGQVWRSDDLLHALLLVSANDAAVALAERTAGSLEQFAGMMDATAARLGFADSPVLRDPAGLDDEFSVDGGNLVSARDLAIVTRTFLSYPELAAIVAKPEYRFSGGDGNPHRLRNHNGILRTYPGAVGVKTGYTKRAGHSLIAAATRDGRTMIAVVVSAANPYGSASLLMDRGFATTVEAQADLDHLPPVRRGTADDPATLEAPAARPVSTPTVQADGGGAGWVGDAVPLGLLIVGGAPAVAILARRRRQRRAMRPEPWQV